MRSLILNISCQILSPPYGGMATDAQNVRLIKTFTFVVEILGQVFINALNASINLRWRLITNALNEAAAEELDYFHIPHGQFQQGRLFRIHDEVGRPIPKERVENVSCCSTIDVLGNWGLIIGGRHRRKATTDGYLKTLEPQLRQVANRLGACGKVDNKLKVVRLAVRFYDVLKKRAGFRNAKTGSSYYNSGEIGI